jgi:hypothetical protein
MLFTGSCAKAPDKEQGKPEATEPSSGALVDFIKKSKLVNFPSSTIGNAFDYYKYLNNKDWRMKQEGTNFTVSFLGWFGPDALKEEDRKSGVSARGLEVMFVVNPDGSFYLFMVSKIESGSDGKMKRYQLQNSDGILASIYANKKVEL